MELLQIDGVFYSSYGQYLSEVGHSSYYMWVQESVVAEVLELSSEWSSGRFFQCFVCFCKKGFAFNVAKV